MPIKRPVLIFGAAAVLAAVGAGGYYAWTDYRASQLPAGIVSVNGRVEATQVDIATKIPGRVIEIVPHEGELVSAGEVVARIDTSETAAQLRQAEASAELARQTLVTRQAAVASDEAQLSFANEQMRRTATLVDKGWSTHETYDLRQEQLKSAQAALKAAQSQVDEARAAVKTADARVEELKAVVDESTIRSPVRGRVQYRLVELGAVVPPGGKIATVIDLADVYTTVFLPAPQAGRLKIGDEARVVVDAAPEYVFPATVSFVAPESQFTPKTVEVQSEREQLVFRVKLQAPFDLLKGIEDQVKAGLRGVGYVRIDPAAQWPAKLAIKTPPTEQADR
ncbi:HlyD family secretion protein [Roseiarcus fermentans]|uniref:HlyD family secretion protein n=1 Tax=Roseiarcus fermentans TaxID=1473586 RepID=A0A366EV38_9HYPH|nr:HlyD family efflux transporter periplasmic adaptor subunit [Roseiarcus fermentans]RBP05796.1 HlyD family secretion protein [Roseiarcus fermentans]